jgi:transposase-like protein
MKLSTHDFRKRAVTRAYKNDMTVSAIADVFGMSEQNVLKSYLDKKSLHVPEAHFKKAGKALLPKI